MRHVLARVRGLARALLLAGCLLSSGLAPAQPVYRCGPDGREFSQTPCRDGRAFDPGDTRTEAERAAAREVAERERRLAARLRQERLAREAEGRRQGVAGFHTAPRPQPAASEPVKGAKKKAKRKPAPPPPSGAGT